MKNIHTLNTKHEFTPEQALLAVLEDLENCQVEALAVVYKVRDDKDSAYVYYPSAASRMTAETLYYLGGKLQERAIGDS